MPEIELSELSDTEYLHNLSCRISRIPARYGTDQYDCDRLSDIAEKLLSPVGTGAITR